MSQGAKALSDAELVAILIRSGNREQSALDMAKQMLIEAKNDLDRFAALSPSDLMKRKGMGEAKAMSIVAALELGMRRRNTAKQERPRLSTSAQIFEEVRPLLADLQMEEFWLVLLDRGLRLIDLLPVSRGGVHGTVADPKVIFRKALERGASCMVVCHNHPSGQLRPSEEDIRLTQKLVAGGRLLDIIVQDHLIVTSGGFYSFADNGQIG